MLNHPNENLPWNSEVPRNIQCGMDMEWMWNISEMYGVHMEQVWNGCGMGVE